MKAIRFPFAALLLAFVSAAFAQQYEFRAWVALFAPAGTPKAIVDRLNAEIKKALDSPDIRLEAFEPWYMTPEQTAARIRSDYDKYAQLIKLTGVRVE